MQQREIGGGCGDQGVRVYKVRVARAYLHTNGDDLVERNTLKTQEEEGITKNGGMGTRCKKNKERRQVWLQMKKERV